MIEEEFEVDFTVVCTDKSPSIAQFGDRLFVGFQGKVYEFEMADAITHEPVPVTEHSDKFQRL